jgi:hypothetical protein
MVMPSKEKKQILFSIDIPKEYSEAKNKNSNQL